MGILVSTALTLYQNLWTITIGRFFFSFSAGMTLIAFNLILNETIPRHLNSIFGNLINFGFITGLCIQLTLGLAFPSLDTQAAKTTQLWRIAFGFQLIPCCINLLLWLVLYKYETPQYIVNKGRSEDALVYLKKIYRVENEKELNNLLEELKEVA